MIVVTLALAFIVLRCLDKRKKLEKLKEKRRAKKQAKLERKQAKMRQRIEFEHRQNLEKLQRQMERTDQKYNQSENR